MRSVTLFVFLLATSMNSFSQTAKKYLALGDSYTIGESVAEHERWPNQLAKSLSKLGKAVNEPRIIATTGWRTDDLKKAIINAKLNPEYDLVSLLIGVNNFYQNKSVDQYRDEFNELLEIAMALANGKKENVFVVSIPDYGYTPFGKAEQKEITKGIDSFNNVNKLITEAWGIRYVYITDISRKGFDQPELVAADGLHPSGRQYAEWVARILEKLQ
jgi:lysophospholipase L1-like esterase